MLFKLFSILLHCPLKAGMAPNDSLGMPAMSYIELESYY